MSVFSIEVPADPRWLHVARATAIAGVSAMPTADVDFLDDALLAIGESVLEVATNPGVAQLGMRVEISDDLFAIDLTGTGDEIEYDDGDGVFEAVLSGLADERSIRREREGYAVRFSMTAPIL